MKKIISFILAITMLTAFITSAFATGEEASETQNLTIKYDIGTVVKSNTISALSALTEQTSNGFFKSNSDSSSTGLKFYNDRGTAANNGIDISSGSYVTLDVYVPVEGLYTISGNHPHFENGGVINVYVNGSGNENMVGSYDSSPASSNITSGYQGADKSYNKDEEFNFKNVSFNEGWNSIKFVAADPANPAENTIYKGTLRTFTLTLGDGSGYALMGLREAELTVGDESANKYTIKTFNSSTASEISEGLTHTSANTNIATVADGVITAVGGGVTTVTVSDGTGLSYDITVTVNDPTMPTILYDISKMIYDWNATANGTMTVAAFTEDFTNGFFRLQGTSNTKPTIAKRSSSAAWCYVKVSQLYATFDVYVPAAGNYTMTMTHPVCKTYTDVNVYVNGSAEPTGIYSCYNSEYSNSYSYSETDEITNIPLNEGWNSFKFTTDTKDTYGTVSSFTLSAGTGDVLIPYLNGDTTLEVNETATLSGFLSSTATAANVTYESSNDDCVTVGTDGTITAVKPGKATITMTTAAATATAGNTYSVEITVPGDAPDTVAYGTNINGTIKVEGTDVTRGTDVTVTASEIENKIFRHWVIGTEENGTVVSTAASYTFPLMTNTYLTAVYTDAPADNAKIVEFFNWNGDYLSQSVLGENNSYEAPTPSLIGFSFSNKWRVDEETYLDELAVFGDVTRAVAEFTPTGSYSVDGENCAYDAEVTKTASKEMAWYRDGVLVGYGKEYTYNVWNTVGAITSKSFTEKTPLVVLDAHIKDDNACMIEYDNGGKTIKEVGILFGDSDATVDSADSKATSQRDETHGQFTAKPRTAGSATHARGYIIYEDGEDYKVIYTEAIALTTAG